MKLNKYAKLSDITFGSIEESNKNFITGRFFIHNYDEIEEQFMKILENQTVRLTIETEESILDEKEREYLSGVIKPFRDRISSIQKILWDDAREYLFFGMKDEPAWTLCMFKKGTMYKNMVINKEYSLDDLDL